MLLTPRMAYQREFFGEGLFFCGPAGALFRAEVFRALGGFSDEGVASDHLFWMRACKTASVLLMPADLFWYRLHPAQEFQSAKGQREYARVPGLVWRALQEPDCPLTPDEREQAKRNRAYHVARRTFEDLRRGRCRLRVEPAAVFEHGPWRLAAVSALAHARRVRGHAARRRRRLPHPRVGPAPRRHGGTRMTASDAPDGRGSSPSSDRV